MSNIFCNCTTIIRQSCSTWTEADTTITVLYIGVAIAMIFLVFLNLFVFFHMVRNQFYVYPSLIHMMRFQIAKLDELDNKQDSKKIT